MRKSVETDENESLNTTDLSRVFAPGDANTEENGLRCSTPRKQQEALNAQQEQTMPAAEVIALASETNCNDQLVTQSSPQNIGRRKRTNPKRRAERLRREIRILQRSTNFMIPRLPFGRVVREILMGECHEMFRITVGALEALQTATEMFMTQRFQDAYLLTHHRSRVTLEVRDMALTAYICKQYGVQ